MGGSKSKDRDSWNEHYIDICGWNQALEHLLDHNKLAEKNTLGSRDYPFIYRGAPNAEWQLSTHLEREYNNSKLKEEGRSINVYEKVLLRNFRKYARIHFSWEGMNYLDEMVVAQHHELPTRLLDWTHSVLVALYFATKGHKNTCGTESDGIVWRLHHDEATNAMTPKLQAFLEKQDARSFTTEMLQARFSSLKKLQRNKAFELIVLDPPMLDERIVNQASVFTLISGRADCAYSHEKWQRQKRHTDLIQRYKIKHSAKREIRDILQLLNVTNRMLFPGPDGVAATLKDRYSAGLP